MRHWNALGEHHQHDVLELSTPTRFDFDSYELLLFLTNLDFNMLTLTSLLNID